MATYLELTTVEYTSLLFFKVKPALRSGSVIRGILLSYAYLRRWSFDLSLEYSLTVGPMTCSLLIFPPYLFPTDKQPRFE